MEFSADDDNMEIEMQTEEIVFTSLTSVTEDTTNSQTDRDMAVSDKPDGLVGE